MAETDEQGNYIREYVYGANHLIVGLKVDGAWYNYHRNHRGDVVAITDETGNLAAEYTYDSWGKPVTKNVNDEKLNNQPIRYASYYYDEDLKLYYLMARYYHPEHAVFLSVDPILDSDESIEMANGYSYVTNNSLIKIDVTGLREDRLENAGPGISFSPYSSGGLLKWLQKLMRKGIKKGNNIISRIDDRTQVIFRKDFGKDAHELPGYPRNIKINHYNIELQTRRGKKGKWKKRFSLHIVVDKKGRIKRVF